MSFSKLLGFLAVFGASASAFAYERTPFTYERLDRNDTMVLVLDQQVGLFTMVQDLEPAYYKQNVLAHAAVAQAFDLPIVLTTSADTGANGPLFGEILEMFPDAPLIRRGGEINAWDNSDIREAIAKTNKSQIIIAGILTDVCTAFCALSLREAGYSVFANIEASGTTSAMVRDAANDRMKDAGVQLLSLVAIIAELMRDWRTPPTTIGPLALFDSYLPGMGMVIRAHRSAVENGALQPGEAELP
ncbi:hypothetical protein ACHAQA_002377 [Verticillium albo-atrum]